MSDPWSQNTKNLLDDSLVKTMETVLDARSKERQLKSRIDGTMSEINGIIEDLIESQEHYVVLSAPSRAAMEGSIALTRDTIHAIRPTRPSDDLIQEFKKSVTLAGLEDLWRPSSLIAWNFGIIRRYMNRRRSGAVLPNVLLGLARFGEAQLCGASEDVMRLAVEDFKAGRFRTHRQWREVMVGNKVVLENVTRDFKGDMVRFMETGSTPEECLIHELEMPFYAQMALQIAFEQIDKNMWWKMGKIHYQAFDRKVDVKDIDRDDLACPICLIDFENKKSNDEEKQFTPLYDVMEDNRQPIEMTCGHIFGATCIERWLFEKDNCPLCRTTLVGRDRKLKPISQENLSSITTYAEGESVLYYEDMDFDQDLHKEIAKGIRRHHLAAFLYLRFQFLSLKEIDSRLGTLKRSSVGQFDSAPPVARWMDDDWKKFATNALTLRLYMEDCIRSHPKWIADPSTVEIEAVLTKMLNDYHQRSQL